MQAVPNLNMIADEFLTPDDPEYRPSGKYEQLISDAKKSLVPSKSAATYNTHFAHFSSWMAENGRRIADTTGHDLAAYLQDISAKYAASTLWTR